MNGLKTLENKMVLIVADTVNTQDLLADYLKGSGFRVLKATDGQSALETAIHLKPDIILLDAVLPGDIDGFETCSRLKGDPRTQSIPVIFITAHTNAVDKIRGLVLGAVDYISKPIQSEEVLVRLKTHLTLQRLRKDLEQRNARLREEIAEREKLISELDAFAHTVAHDLKNPLGVTINQAKFVRKFHSRMSKEEFEDNLDMIVRNGHKMNNIIDELMLLSSVRIEQVTPEPLNMAEIIEEALDRLSFLIQEYQAEVIVPPEFSWPAAWGYGPWIEEVWINYISNAIKYGGRPPRVELGSHIENDGMIHFWIKDNGDGLNDDEQARLFVPFNRFNQVRVEGHGLGLSIVQRIMTKLGGRVGVVSSSQPDEGSIFSFYLPGMDA